MKKKIMVIGGAVIATILVVILIISLIPKNHETTKTPTDVPSTSVPASNEIVEVEDIKAPESQPSDPGSFIEPNESEADKILEENKKEAESKVDSKPQSTSDKKPTSPKQETSSFEDSKNEVKQTAEDYLKENNIDPKTAGETGELCAHCEKKIWDPDKYGLCIPGMPDNYENSGYCLGTCGITLG